jgi:hypothetical protein
MTEMNICTTTLAICTYGLAPNSRFSFKSLFKDVKNCIANVGLPAIVDDLNPLTPSATDAAGNILTALSQGQYNAALTYAASAGLTYPNKSSIFRGLMGNSSKLATAAEAMPMLAIDIALVKGVIAEAKGCL